MKGGRLWSVEPTQFGIYPWLMLLAAQLTHLNLSEYYFCLA